MRERKKREKERERERGRWRERYLEKKRYRGSEEMTVERFKKENRMEFQILVLPNCKPDY